MIPTFDLSSPLLALISAGALGFITAIVPIGIAEALALAIGAVVPPTLALGMWLVFTVAHVTAKLPWYWLGLRADRVTHGWVQRFVTRAREMLKRHPGYGAGVLALSAVTSVPPFHLSSIAAGMTGIPFAQFFGVCLAGRLVRFGLLAAVPGLLRLWWN